MQFPLSLWDFNLWLAVTAIILLATSQMLSPHYGTTSILINKRRLRRAALLVGSIFMLITITRIAVSLLLGGRLS